MATLKCVPYVQPLLFVVSSAPLKRVAVLVCVMGWLDSLPTWGSPAFHSPRPWPSPSQSLHVQPPLRGMNPLFHICFASPSSHRPTPRPAAPLPAGPAFTQHLVWLPSESAEQPTLGSVRPLPRSQHLKASASWLTSRRGFRVDVFCGFVPGVSVPGKGQQRVNVLLGSRWHLDMDLSRAARITFFLLL